MGEHADQANDFIDFVIENGWPAERVSHGRRHRRWYPFVGTGRECRRCGRTRAHHGAKCRVPKCPKCGKEARGNGTRYGVRYDCRPCALWSWGRKPLVNAATHAARNRAHRAFDRMWKSWGYDRDEAYALLAIELGVPEPEAHMAYMDEATANRVPGAVQRIAMRAIRDRGTA